MKSITPYLLKFALSATTLTLSFRFLLSYFLGREQFTSAIIFAVIYAVLMFSAGWYFGRKDNEYLPIYDVGFRFHLTTFIIHNGLSESWYLLGYNSKYEHINSVHITLLIWSGFLILHFIFYMVSRRNAIHHLDKTDIFE